MDQTNTAPEKEKKSLLQYSELRGAIEALNTYSDGLPDKLNAIKLQIEEHLTITDDTGKKKAKQFLSSINSNSKVIKARRLDVTRFLDAAKKRFTDREKELANPFNDYAAQVEAAIADYDKEVARRRQEDEAKKLAEQQAKEAEAQAAREEAMRVEQEQEALRISAQKAEDQEVYSAKMAEINAAKQKAADEAAKRQREAHRARIAAEQKAKENEQKAKEEALKSTKKDAFSHYEITDFDAIPEDLIEISFNFLKIRGYIKEHGAVPGMRVTAKNGYLFDGKVPDTNKHID